MQERREVGDAWLNAMTMDDLPDIQCIMASKDICKLDNYPDANFAGMYGHELPTDPSCVKSRTGYVITFADCPVI